MSNSRQHSSSERKLVAIMFTDIVGYTALMGHDEVEAIKLLESNRQLHMSAIEEFNGKWLKEMGDGTLVSFNTVSDAVNCAMKIQELCRTTEDITLKIGIHQGEVLFDSADVFGDGVNIAARIEAITPAGSIYVSESVSRNIENKKGVKTKFIGEKHFKNVKYPVRIYEVTMDQERSTKNRSTNLNILENSIGVLPFVNMSSDPEQEYFSDGLTEEIITDLSQLGRLLVISRSSMMTFKGTDKKIIEIANEVGVRYILEGSVRKVGKDLRITAQLIDAQNDNHIWAEKYSGTVEDIFDIQERVSGSIVSTLNLKLTTREEMDLNHRPIENISAYEYYIRGLQEMWKYTEKGYLQSLALLTKSLEIEGKNALLNGTLSVIYTRYYHYCIPDPSFLQKASDYASKCIELDPDNAKGHYALGFIEWVNGNLQESSRLVKKSLEREPNDTEALQRLSITYTLVGWSSKGVDIAKKVVKIDPLTPVHEFFLGFIEGGFWDGKIQESLPAFIRWFSKEPDAIFCRHWCMLIYAFLGMKEECISIANLILRDTPHLIFGKFAGFFKNAVMGKKKEALKYITDDMKSQASTMDFMINPMAYGYFLLNEEDETLNWLEKAIGFDYGVYYFFKKLYDERLIGNKRYQIFLSRIKYRRDSFEF